MGEEKEGKKARKDCKRRREKKVVGGDGDVGAGESLIYKLSSSK